MWSIVVTYEQFLRRTLTAAPVGILHFSFQTWSPPPLALAFGLVLLHAVTVWTAVLIVQVASLRWRLRRGLTAAAAFVLRAMPLGGHGRGVAGIGVGSGVRPGRSGGPGRFLVSPAGGARDLASPTPSARLAGASARVRGAGPAGSRARHVPSVLQFTDRARQQVIERRSGPEALNQRAQLQAIVNDVGTQIDGIAELPDLGRRPRLSGRCRPARRSRCGPGPVSLTCG